MSLKLDVERGMHTGADNFTSQLLRLMTKADKANRVLLAKGFPNAHKCLQAWTEGREVPDLPYDATL